MREIIESDFQVATHRLSDAEYTASQLALPFVCTDAIITDVESKKLYLAWRQTTPAKGWWVIGGGVKNGQTPIMAMVSNFRRETGLELLPSEFSLIHDGINFTQWTIDKPISNLHLPYKVCLSDEKLNSINDSLDDNEYDSNRKLKAFSIEEMLQAINEGVGYPQTVLYYDKIFGTSHFDSAYKKWRVLRKDLPSQYTPLEYLCRELEESLLEPENRQNYSFLDRILANNYLEYGASGKQYTKDNVLSRLTSSGNNSYKYLITEFSSIQENFFTFVNLFKTQETNNGQLVRNVARISRWEYQSGVWRMTYHQATVLN